MLAEKERRSRGDGERDRREEVETNVVFRGRRSDAEREMAGQLGFGSVSH